MRYPLNLPTQLKQEAEKLAAEQGVSLNQFILWAVSEKVGSLAQKLDDLAFPGITYRRGASGLVYPVLRGRGIRVQTIVNASQHWHWSVEEIGREYQLEKRQVQEVLAFYEKHRQEIDNAITAEQSLEPADG
jgi:uncharacterized protein (DUF433 family)